MKVMITAERSRLLTIPETASRLRVSEVTVRRMLRDGRLAGRQLGGPRTPVRVDEAELERWLQS